jgi:hypothetical protein
MSSISSVPLKFCLSSITIIFFNYKSCMRSRIILKMKLNYYASYLIESKFNLTIRKKRKKKLDQSKKLECS